MPVHEVFAVDRHPDARAADAPLARTSLCPTGQRTRSEPATPCQRVGGRSSLMHVARARSARLARSRWRAPRARTNGQQCQRSTYGRPDDPAAVRHRLDLFAAVLMIFSNILAIFQGIAAIAKDALIVVTRDYAYQLNTTGWGWIHLILGVLILLAGVALVGGAVWARTVGVVVVGLSPDRELPVASVLPVLGSRADRHRHLRHLALCAGTTRKTDVASTRRAPPRL